MKFQNSGAARAYTLEQESLEQIEPINRESVEERVAGKLRQLIVSGQLPVGTPLVQRDLAQRLGVSQTPVRIGLSELEREGLVEVGDTGRALVSRLTREDFEEIYAARLGLEGLAARVGAVAIDDEGVAQMRVLHRELSRLAKARDVDGYLGTRWDFHAICYLASGRTRLVAEVERLYWRAERYNHLVLASDARFRRSVAYYREFLDACESRDGDAAERVIHQSVRGAVDMLSSSLPSELEA
jgi:DNA-binding GntR family transcriptional regulator